MRDLKKILQNQRGVALMMIMTSIIVLMAIYGQFTFDSKISRIKATNILDRSQAKLLAESALQLALARLRLYKEAFNKIQGNEQAKQMVSPQLLNQLWEVPFMFPVPVMKDAPRGFRDTVEKFEKESLLDGEMKVTIQNVSNRLDINMLRMDMSKFKAETFLQDSSSQIDVGATAIQSNVSVAQTLVHTLKRLVDEKKDKDDTFDDRNGEIKYQDMISNLKFFVSDYQSLTQDPLSGEAESNFDKIPLTPKYGPMASASEMYAIPGWNDELIELIQNEFSVYPTTQLDLNKLTSNMLRILFPTMLEEDVVEFFRWRDDSETPRYVNTREDLKRYIVDHAHHMSGEDFDERMQLFEAKGITFGSNPNLFRVLAEGTYNRSVYTIVAMVALPVQAQPKTAGGAQGGAAGGAAGGTQGGGQGGAAGGAEGGAQGGAAGGAGGGGAGNQTTQLLEPRVIEIQVN